MDVEPLKRCICGAEVDQEECPYPSGRRTSADGRAMYVVNCMNNECGWQCLGWGKDGARKAWNTRHDHSPDAGKMGEDSARLDWFSGGIDRFLSQCPTGEWCAQDDTVVAWYGETPRAAIDAARAGERG